MSELTEQEIAGVASYLFELATLKRIRRSGVRDPESVAEHSHRTAVLATVLAAMEGADPARACLLATLHETQETRIGDIPHVGRRYLTAVSNEAVTADQLQACPPAVAAAVQDAVGDHERRASPEAVVARDADQLECLLQALEYRRTGNANVQNWIDSCRAALTTVSAIRIAETAMTMTGMEWRDDA